MAQILVVSLFLFATVSAILMFLLKWIDQFGVVGGCCVAVVLLWVVYHDVLRSKG